MGKQIARLLGGCVMMLCAASAEASSQCTPPPRMSLTFDDGPMGWKTTHVLDVLDQYGVRATFFVVGRQVRANPALTQDIERRGHELAVHTYNHPNLTQVSVQTRHQEIERTLSVLRPQTSQPIRYWRAPYGALPRDTSFARQQGLTHVLWTIDSRDYQRPSRDVQIHRVVSQFHPNAIILFHDHAPSTHESLPEIIAQAHAQGYELVPVHELLTPYQCPPETPPAPEVLQAPISDLPEVDPAPLPENLIIIEQLPPEP